MEPYLCRETGLTYSIIIFQNYLEGVPATEEYEG